jgi:hypothetical protein
MSTTFFILIKKNPAFFRGWNSKNKLFDPSNQPIPHALKRDFGSSVEI